MQLEDSQIFATPQQISEQDNLTVLVFDLTFNCNTPYFLGDVVNNTPYLPTVQTIVLTDEKINNRQQFYRTIAGKAFEEILK